MKTPIDLARFVNPEREKLLVLLGSLLILVSYHLIFFRFFPNHHGLLGHDYDLFFPRLMDGFLWARNNPAWSIPWFTPAFCGGVPAFPDPQNIYFSLPQLFTFFMNPLLSVYLTVVVMSVAGYSGTYFLLKRIFNTSTPAAMLGATLFLFNGFFIYRMIIGHLGFHSFMLFPWMLYFSLKRGTDNDSTGKVPSWLLNGTIVALIASYMFFAGLVNLLLPTALSGLIIVLGYAYKHDLDRTFWKTTGVASVLFLLVIAAKLNASLAYLGIFDRAHYPLPGIDNISTALYIGFRVLFFPATDSSFQYLFSNIVWGLARHEFEYGVGLVPLVVLGIFLGTYARRLKTLSGIRPRWSQRKTLLLIIGLLLLVPMALNFYQPDWNQFLKQVPVLKNSSSLVRFYSSYLLPVILLSAVLLDKSIAQASLKWITGAALASLVIITNAVTDKQFYHDEKYDPQTINLMHANLKKSPGSPSIGFVGNIEQTNIFRHPSQVSTDFLFGISRLNCYEPMFGYGLEDMPRKTLHPGPVNELTDGKLNIKNPACYVFPKQNACEPGEHFSATDTDRANAFLRFQGYRFNMPVRQVILLRVSLVALLICVIILVGGGITRLRQDRQGK